jgi:hypothetical protein
MKKSALSDLTVGPALESSFPAEKLRQIIVPVDLTNDCTASIDYAIRSQRVWFDPEFTPPLSRAVRSEPELSKPELRSV